MLFNMIRECYRCKKVLTDENWFGSCREYKNYICRDCHRELGREGYHKHREKRLQTVKKYREKYPERCKNIRLRNRFGITLKDYSEMFNKQKGKCKVCGSIKRLRNWHWQ